MMRFSTRQAAALLGVSESRLRAFVRHGFLAGTERVARGAHRFTFQDLVVLRTAKGLLAEKVPARRVKEALARLRAELPDRPLTSLQVVAEGDALVVRDGDSAWNPESGQVLFDFDVATFSAEVRSLEPVREEPEEAPEAPAVSAAEWFVLGADLELTARSEAREAYRRALELDPYHAEAHLALGRLLFEDGLFLPAELQARRARELSPQDPRAAFDHGAALEKLGAMPAAREAYERAATLDPRRRDVYLSLARVCLSLEDEAGAKSARARYETLTQES